MERGKSLFPGHTAAMCSKCHALRRADQQVGPSLEGVATRLTRTELLESMLDPGAKVAPGYGIQMLELTNGSTVTGTQMSETTEATVIKSPDGKLTTHRKTEIKSATKPNRRHVTDEATSAHPRDAGSRGFPRYAQEC